MITATVALAVLVGVSLGLLGGGGSILMVPLLAYVAGLNAGAAIATSLLVVGVTSAVGALSHARAGRVNWRVGLLFGLAGTAGAYPGGVVSGFLPGSLLLVMFAAVMVAAAIAMLRRHRETDPADCCRRTAARIVVEGFAVGFGTGLVGAGGGFLVVPALTLLAGLPMATAVGTSLVVITMNSFAGLAGHLAGVALDWRLAAMVTAAAVVGALAGAPLAARVNPADLRRAFGWFVLVMASVILAKEISPTVGLAVAALTVTVGGMYLSCRLGAFCPLGALYPRG